MLSRELFYFATAGIIGLIVDVAVLYLLRDWIGPFYGRAVSFFAAVLSTWIVNRAFTFQSRPSGLSRRREFTTYLTLMLAGGVVNYAAYSGLVLWSVTVRQHLILGVAAGSVAGMAVNFMTTRFLLFRGRVG